LFREANMEEANWIFQFLSSLSLVAIIIL